MHPSNIFHKHTFATNTLSQSFTNPFAYRPSAECEEAASIVRQYIATEHSEWAEELSQGKMLGVLICKDKHGNTGFLAAFSGTLDRSLTHEWFVPPVLDYEEPCGVFKIEDGKISEINKQISQIETSEGYADAKLKLANIKQEAENDIAHLKAKYATHKEQRNAARVAHPDLKDSLDRESQFEKAEIKRKSKRWEEQIKEAESEVSKFKEGVSRLKGERVRRSNILQRWLFSRMKLHCADGAKVSVHDIFLQYTHTVPPSGTGDCCAPKLLNFAFANGLLPISMAEFWVGASPRGEIRIDGQFYPACQQKCHPTLMRMLANSPYAPVSNNYQQEASSVDVSDKLEIIYEDDYILAANKPSGIITVSVSPDVDTLDRRVKAKNPDITGPGYIHRLDQPTSGIVLFAKTKEAHKRMQSLFESREAKKRYVAILEGEPRELNGEISLPLIPNPDDRPRQMVDFIRGKKAVTRYEVISKECVDGKTLTRVYFYPQTGRTHQLRVHAASPMGLVCPIVGDNLYGHLGKRLMLHADRIEFNHPFTGKQIVIECPPEF